MPDFTKANVQKVLDLIATLTDEELRSFAVEFGRVLLPKALGALETDKDGRVAVWLAPDVERVIQAIKAFRELTGFGLKESKAAVDGARGAFDFQRRPLAWLYPHEVSRWVAAFEEYGVPLHLQENV